MAGGKLKKNDLILLSDSMLINSKVYRANFKVTYENINDRFHRKSIPKKEYDDMIATVRTVFPTLKGTKSGYKEYEKKGKALYYEKVNIYDCK